MNVCSAFLYKFKKQRLTLLHYLVFSKKEITQFPGMNKQTTFIYLEVVKKKDKLGTPIIELQTFSSFDEFTRMQNTCVSK